VFFRIWILKVRAFFLVLASSGMRIGEALKLKVEDLDLNSDPPRINIRGEYTKSGNSRVAFISCEAKEFLEEWLKVRDEELKVAVKRSRFKKGAEDTRVWPFESNIAYFIWRNAVKKAGFGKRFQYNNSLERFTVHPHVLRKFFRTRLGSVIPVDVVEALMGHEGYLTEVYRRYSLEELAKFYKQGEYTLLIFTEAEEVGRLRAEIEERNKQLQTLINGLTAENLKLKSRIEQLEKELKEFKELLPKQTIEELKELSKWRKEFIKKLPSEHVIEKEG